MRQASFKIRNLAIIFAALTSADAAASNLIISTDTTWHAGEVPDLRDQSVQIANGATLTIEGGAEVERGDIQVFGTLNVVGRPDALVDLRGVSITITNNDPDAINDGRVNIAYAYIIGANSSLFVRAPDYHGSITLTDSIVNYTNYWPSVGLGYPIADAHIERNVFYVAGGIHVGTNNNVSVYIKNNVFAELLTTAVENWASDSGATVVENNSFLNTNLALSLENRYEDSSHAAISAADNYFGTTDTALIDEMIHDKKDDLLADSVISTSHTNAPSPGTPRFFAGTDGNDALVGGGAENGFLIGGPGIDTVVYGNASDQYKINSNRPYVRSTLISTDIIRHIAVSDTTAGAGVDMLEGVERLQFSDKSIAFDIDGNAGKVARILGAVFGKDAVANAEYAGTYLALLDKGMSYEDLMMRALNEKLGIGFSDADEIKLLYQNIVGSQPSKANLIHWTATIASGRYTQASFGVLEAELESNATNINLAGLAETGLNFISPTDSNIIVGTANPDTLTGNDGNDIIEGLAGIDTVVYNDAHGQYTVSLNGAVATVGDNGMGIDTLTGVERLEFSDQSLALDLNGNAGKVARILGAVFGKDAVANVFYTGIGLQLLDDGMSYEELMQLALDTKLGAGFSDADEVRLFYRNLTGSQPSQADLDYWTGIIASGQYTQASLGVLVAELELNATNINLAGLEKTGLIFLSASNKNDMILGTAGPDVLSESAENDIIDGLSGIDTVIYGDAHDQYMISLNGPAAKIGDNTSIDHLMSVERLRFSDQSLALDIDGNAGKVARILGAVFGKNAVANAEYARIGLQLLDDGMSYEELMMLALNTKLGAGFSNAAEVRLLYRNLVGSQPSQAELNHWIGTIASGQHTQASLGVMAAELELNATNINLAGLVKTGLVYTN
ncbi:hypothetical protein [Methylobacter luteus]|uniref:hypothetical protein n=1 Tax=Methylobacter luteus TaxID=415 RepID=UPI00040C64F2|nr:hypothetical protein [Methylobacter luteus]